MDSDQARGAQQPWVLPLLSQEQAVSPLAPPCEHCFVGHVAKQSEFWSLSLHFVGLALVSHLCSTAGGEAPQWKQESKNVSKYFILYA